MTYEKHVIGFSKRFVEPAFPANKRRPCGGKARSLLLGMQGKDPRGERSSGKKLTCNAMGGIAAGAGSRFRPSPNAARFSQVRDLEQRYCVGALCCPRLQCGRKHGNTDSIANLTYGHHVLTLTYSTMIFRFSSALRSPFPYPLFVFALNSMPDGLERA